ncbi:MAG: 4Fe-4S dicluster domain-containing protein [Deltaproteobacteria bacterium]|nr:4Fe-4S dicluster domain-containing protein [Deltaproteobacteria bacterium]MBW2027137.1 4Fe-4S dicluster domain-containing protein [Deltaproteobacteria bacterium]MBW2127315.1 4Fe-4S dicluster domain-containing protein [Deltaproteobacteria bacterium]
MSYFVVNENCNGCLSCVENCPANALAWKDEGPKRTILHNMARCVRCANCWRICPQHAIEFQHFLENQWYEVKTLDLVHCKICGAPLYTADLKRTISEKMGSEPEPLCPKHRESEFAARQAFIALRKSRY